MSKYNFEATHGVHLADDDGTWAHFTHDETADERPSLTGQRGGIGSRVYRFGTDDAKVADRVRKLADGEYGIKEVKSSDDQSGA